MDGSAGNCRSESCAGREAPEREHANEDHSERFERTVDLTVIDEIADGFDQMDNAGAEWQDGRKTGGDFARQKVDQARKFETANYREESGDSRKER